MNGGLKKRGLLVEVQGRCIRCSA